MIDSDYEARLDAYDPKALLHEYGIPGAVQRLAARVHELEAEKHRQRISRRCGWCCGSGSLGRAHGPNGYGGIDEDDEDGELCPACQGTGRIFDE